MKHKNKKLKSNELKEFSTILHSPTNILTWYSVHVTDSPYFHVNVSKAHLQLPMFLFFISFLLLLRTHLSSLFAFMKMCECNCLDAEHRREREIERSKKIAQKRFLLQLNFLALLTVKISQLSTHRNKGEIV